MLKTIDRRLNKWSQFNTTSPFQGSLYPYVFHSNFGWPVCTSRPVRLEWDSSSDSRRSPTDTIALSQRHKVNNKLGSRERIRKVRDPLELNKTVWALAIGYYFLFPYGFYRIAVRLLWKSWSDRLKSTNGISWVGIPLLESRSSIKWILFFFYGFFFSCLFCALMMILWQLEMHCRLFNQQRYWLHNIPLNSTARDTTK